MKKYLFSLLLTSQIALVYAQNTATYRRIDSTNDKKSNVFFDALSDLSQLSSDVSTSQNKLSFQASFFGVGSIFHPNWRIDTVLKTKRWLRDIQPKIAYSYSSSGGFNSKAFDGGITFAIFNRRDSVLYLGFSANDRITDSIQPAFIRLYKSEITAGSDARYRNLDADIDRLRSSHNFHGINRDDSIFIMQHFKINNRQCNPDSLFKKHDAVFKDCNDKLSKSWLVTATPDFYKDFTKKDSSVISLSLQGLKGLHTFGNNKQLNLDLKLAFDAGNDTLIKGGNFKRMTTDAYGGLDWVIATKPNKDHDPLIEFQALPEYSYVIASMYPKEPPGVFKMNGTLAISIAKNTWVPFNVTWNTSNGKFFGSFSFKVNITQKPFSKST